MRNAKAPERELPGPFAFYEGADDALEDEPTEKEITTMIGSESLWGRLFKKKPDPFLLPSERAPSVDTYLAGFRAGISTVVKAAETCSDIDASSRVIQALAEAGGAVRSNDELADLLGARKGTVSKWITKLEAAGKVRRHRDGRQVQIKLVA